MIYLVAAVLVVGAGAYFFYQWLLGPRYSPGRLASLPKPTVAENSDHTKLVTDDGVELHSFCDGDGAKVLYVHGGPAHPVTSIPEGLRPLLASYQLHFYHLRGCGLSSRPIKSFSKDKQGGRYYSENVNYLTKVLGIEAHLQDIDRLRQHLQEDKIILMGHSFGGFLAAMYACEYPERVKGLILVCPANVVVASEGLFGEIKAKLPEKRKDAFADYMKTYLDFSPKFFSRTEKDMQDINNQCTEWAQEAFGWPALTEKEKEYTGGFMSHAIYFGIGNSNKFLR